MRVRIRVHPQYGGLGMMGGFGGVNASAYYTSKLQDQKQIASLQLGYERQLANERIERVRLEERLRNPYAAFGAGMGYGLPAVSAYNPYSASMLGSSMLGGAGFFGSLGLGGLF